MIRRFLREHETHPYSYADKVLGDGIRGLATLATPRTIGEYTANYLLLTKPTTAQDASVVACATYQHGKNFPYSDTGVSQEWPLRFIALRAEAPSTFTYNGTMDAHEYPLTAEMVDDLITDLSSST